MTSSNINKIVQSNINFKPWMLSKNANEIVNTYVQKIYKQIPTSFRKDIKAEKVAKHQPENRGPLSTWKNLELQLPLATITPRALTMKKSNSKVKQQNNLVNSLKMSSKNNQQMGSKLVGTNLTASKRLLKTPSYKIYKPLRYGSSASSSHSSILKRYDDRKRQKQNAPTQVNYLARSFHTRHLEPTYARYLMPARNQQVESNLGSIPDAVKFSSNIIKDLMSLDKFTKNQIAGHKNNFKSTERNSDAWNNSSSLSQHNIQKSKESAIRLVKWTAERSMRKAKLSPEHRDYARINVSRVAQLKHPKPPNELFTALHDRNNTELHEKHRRNRMKKLGLIESSSASEKEKEVIPRKKQNEIQNESESSQSAPKHSAKSTLSTITQPENNILSTGISLHTQQIEEIKSSSPISSMDSRSACCAVSTASPIESITATPKGYTTTSPIVAARALMPNKNNMRSYRYNRSDFFSTKKY